MTHVATLISDPAVPALDDAILERAMGALRSAAQPRWLAPGLAADIGFTPTRENDERSVADDIRRLCGGRPVDVVIQSAGLRRKKLFVADMDSTMIGQECIDELAEYVGLKAHVAAITERAMRGDIEFEPALRERVALLKGLPASVIEAVIESRIRPTPGARTLVATMRANGAHTCLVSGGFSAFTERVGAMIGFDENRGNILLIEPGGNLIGQVAEPVLGREAKRASLIALRQRLGLAKADTLAVGDGANDIPMLEEAGLGVAYHAKPRVTAAAAAHIDHGDLTALLYVQGYRQSDFVAEDRRQTPDDR